MKNVLLLLLFLFFGLMLKAQSIIDLGSFPSQISNDNPLLTSDLLKRLNWDSIKTFCDKTNGHYANIHNFGLKTVYEYVKQGGVAYFNIVSYKGSVLEYNSKITNTTKPSNTSYFDKTVWVSYVYDKLINLPDCLKISLEEPSEILKAYYKLLGVDTRDEYGWICEYSTVGMPTEKRRALIEIIKQNRTDLLKKLLDYPNVQIQLYASDGLIYIDHETKNEISNLSLNDTLNFKEYKAILENQLLTESDWKKIYKLRDSGQMVKTCCNGTGSYKIYETKIFELLSEKAISEIQKKYEELKNSGYFN